MSYRTLSHPAVTLWEQRESLKYLKANGASKVDEAAIFRTIEAMRKLTDDAAANTRSARRRKARSNHVTQKSPINKQGKIVLLDDMLSEEINHPAAKPFENIEEW